MTLPGPTPSTARGMHERIMGHRGTRWRPRRCYITRCAGRMPISTKELIKYPRTVIQPGSNRTTRTWVYLVDVEIVLEVALESDNPAKYEAMFERRISKGQAFDLLPTMGPKQCVVTDFGLVDPGEVIQALPINEDLGIQPYGCDYEDPTHPWYYAPMSVVNGVIEYPSWDEVRKLGIKRVFGGAA